LLNRTSEKLSALGMRKALLLATKLFSDVGIDTASLDAKLLLAHVLKKSHLEMILCREEDLAYEDLFRFLCLVRRRLCFEPIAYILGEKEFYGYSFAVDHRCLIPRPDTELIVEKCLNILEKFSCPRVIELCTGSGAITIAILLERDDVSAIASDISEDALVVAKLNAEKLGVLNRVEFRSGDLFLPYAAEEKASLIVANPPYIKSNDIATLPNCVRDHEPIIALDGEEDGLFFYRRIISLAPLYLESEGFLVLEIGFDQATDIKKLVTSDWQSVEVFKDLGFLDRCIVLQLRAQ
jgi:release factor glutamine methyltransferase